MSVLCCRIYRSSLIVECLDSGSVFITGMAANECSGCCHWCIGRLCSWLAVEAQLIMVSLHFSCIAYFYYLLCFLCYFYFLLLLLQTCRAFHR